MANERPVIPCHIIAGPLGIGKTTAILDYLHRHAPFQKIAVLVNDFGKVGIDSSLLSSQSPDSRVKNVPGGCICCSMLSQLVHHIDDLLTGDKITRLIIEPSGMASPMQITDLLKDHQQELSIEVRPVIVMLSAEGFDAQTYEKMPYYRAFTDAADIMVFNRCDKANEVKKRACQDWANQLKPVPKHVLMTSHGQLPDKLFDIENTSVPEATDETTDHQHGYHHHDDEPTMHAGGWTASANEIFEKDRMLINMMRICHQGINGIPITRLKGIFRTDAGWLSIHIANGEVSVLPSNWQEDNRMDWITLGSKLTENLLIDALYKPLAWRDNQQTITSEESV